MDHKKKNIKSFYQTRQVTQESGLFLLSAEIMSAGYFFVSLPPASNMGRILGIDFGTKRIGIAVTDPLNIFASPLITVRNHEFEDFLKEYIKKEKIDGFVVGYPRTVNNEASEIVKYVDSFIRKLGKAFPEIPVHLVDERFTSEMALSTMIEGGVRKKQRRNKEMVDKISAAIILQSFLDQRSRSME